MPQADTPLGFDVFHHRHFAEFPCDFARLLYAIEMLHYWLSALFERYFSLRRGRHSLSRLGIFLFCFYAAYFQPTRLSIRALPEGCK